MVTTVLLNVDWMCAIPVETFLRTFFLVDFVLVPAAGEAAVGGGGVLVFDSDMTVGS
jgi:hypothetical protein